VWGGVVDCGLGARGGPVGTRLLRARFGVGCGWSTVGWGRGWTGRGPLTACAVLCGLGWSTVGWGRGWTGRGPLTACAARWGL